MSRFAHTLGTLAVALRGMPRAAPIFVRLPDGSLARVRYVRPVFTLADEREVSPEGGAGGIYSIALELE